MSTLANTKWTITGNSIGTESVIFNGDGQVIIVFPNGATETGHWAEAADGSFTYQWPHSTSNPNVNCVFFGKHTNGIGDGYWCSVDTMLNLFTMKRQ